MTIICKLATQNTWHWYHCLTKTIKWIYKITKKNAWNINISHCNWGLWSTETLCTPLPTPPPTKSHSFKQPCICMFHRLDVYTLQSSTACQFLIRFSTIEYRVKFQFQISWSWKSCMKTWNRSLYLYMYTSWSPEVQYFFIDSFK